MRVKEGGGGTGGTSWHLINISSVMLCFVLLVLRERLVTIFRCSKSLPRLPLQATRDTKAMDIESSVHIILLSVTLRIRRVRRERTQLAC